MKRILVPTDFSKEAKNALEHAINIAEMVSAEIVLLNILENVGEGDITSSGDIKGSGMNAIYMAKLAEKNKAKIEKSLEKINSKTTIKSVIKVGKVYKVIAHQAEHLKCDMIVMGTKGASGMQEMLVGSNAEKVVKVAKCPVLTVNGKCKISNFRSAVFVNNLKTPDMTKDASTMISKFQSYFDTQLHLLFVNTPLNFNTTAHAEAEMLKFCKRNKLDNFDLNIYNDTSETNGIHSFAKHKKADLIILPLSKPGKSLLGVFSSSTSGNIVNHANLPVLSYPTK